MTTRGSVRRKSVEIFEKVIELRKKGFSYTEIKMETGIAKSTINNWLNLAGLTLGNEHLQIQAKKRLDNRTLGTEASRVTRARRKDGDIQNFIKSVKKYLNDPFFVAGIMLYEAEGSKGFNSFSNSDYRLILTYVRFLEKYLLLNREKDLIYRVYIHETRKNDLGRIKNFWANKLRINPDLFRISWKHNIVTNRKSNPDYAGQLSIRVKGFKYFSEKILAISDIILTKYQRI